MNEYLIILIFVLWYGLSLYLSETFGKKGKPGVEWLFFISMLFSPVIGFIVALAKKR
jgi:choline-glycine betaine transporter